VSRRGGVTFCAIAEEGGVAAASCLSKYSDNNGVSSISALKYQKENALLQ